MCGITGVAVCRGHDVGVSDADVARMRDAMAHRGPDGAGLWRGEHVVLGHRRLAVVDVSSAGSQPMESRDGRFVLVYNGELYNDAELRRELSAEGVVFRSSCDTETVLESIARWWRDGVWRLRGMYALACYDVRRRMLLLARDPLGIKPLVTWQGARGGTVEFAFASELPALLKHPRVERTPNLRTLSAYMTTIRTTLGAMTLYEGVLALRPGECVEVDLSGDAPEYVSFDWWREHRPVRGGGADAAGRVREVVEDSIRRHLRADVPTCALLSGGLDSTIVCSVAKASLGELRTYCAGARDEGEAPDFTYARLVAGMLGTTHTEAPVTRELFLERWRELVRRLGRPLSTPNEVAIHEVSERIRADGCVVTLSGEGADELFGGYDQSLRAAAKFVREQPRGDGGAFEYASAAWAGLDAKRLLFRSEVWDAVGRDESAVELYRREFGMCLDRAGDAHQAHLMMQRRVNLTGLLERLDGATMLASVEGRTPLADLEVALCAESLPMEEKFVEGEGGAAAQTKRVLRRAFSREVPEAVLARPKASFPLPFQGWVGGMAEVIRGSGLLSALFRPSAIETVADAPEEFWHLAWPMANLALWGESW
ncbi:MAG: asparagine synthase (glutamine-hydrolyzing) [Phycisphaeraceae bacterium]|nr:asparagine synthase (glutamine-hydrolyzing) [Phycisphaeraceae bacterium]